MGSGNNEEGRRTGNMIVCQKQTRKSMVYSMMTVGYLCNVRQETAYAGCGQQVAKQRHQQLADCGPASRINQGRWLGMLDAAVGQGPELHAAKLVTCSSKGKRQIAAVVAAMTQLWNVMLHGARSTPDVAMEAKGPSGRYSEKL